ncbi:MAG: TolC family protein [Proteobacteria bacterium]|nr:TolC family protein [Pseudomonadota bacterium]MBU4470656.1 TolC family protein [Pseudomonadota bacterium]MCG2751249.1 TolC family protein [Desulfobacteraceae bacterium]
MKILSARAFFQVICVVLLMGRTDSMAQNTPSTLTLSDAIVTALKQNPRVKAARYEVDVASAQVTQARSGFLPQLGISETYSRTNSPLWAFGTKLNQSAITAGDFNPALLNSPDPIDNFKTALSLSWNIFDGGQTWIGFRQARENVKAGTLALQRTEQEVIGQVAATYVGCLMAEQNLLVVEQSLQTALAHLKVVEDRERGGLAVKSDVLRARVRISDLVQQKLHAESQVKISLAALNAVMGQSEVWSETVTLEDSFQKCIPTEGRLDEWVAKALEHRPDLQQLRIQEGVAGQQVNRERAARYPSLALQGNYEINSEDFNDNEDNYTVGAAVQLPLYTGHRISGRTAEATAVLSRIGAMREGLELAIRMDTQRAFYDARSSWQSIEVARDAVNQAEEGLRIVFNRYTNGLLAMVSLLDAQTALQQAQTQHFKAMHDYKVARISLALAGGVIGPDFQ